MSFSWRPGALARGTIAIALGTGLRTALQGLVFIVLGRALGVEGFGAFAALLAVAGSLGQLSSLGTQMVMLRTAARDPASLPGMWGATLLVTCVTGALLLVASIPLSSWLAPAGVGIEHILLVGIAEIVAAPVSMIAVAAFQARERMGGSSVQLAAPAATRAAAAVVFWIIAASVTEDLTWWCALYAAAGVLAAAFALWSVRNRLGPARCRSSGRAMRQVVADGWPFAAGGIGLRVLADIDKAMLARFDTLAATGGYAAAYRVADLLLMPTLALLTAALPRMFRIGEAGSPALIKYARVLAVPSLALGVLSSIVLWCLAPALPWVLGPSFTDAVTPLRWIAFLPLVALPRLLVQHVLVGVDRHRTAVAFIVSGAVLNIAMNLVAIPGFGWKGAVAATYATEALMAVGMAIALRHTRGRTPAEQA